MSTSELNLDLESIKTRLKKLHDAFPQFQGSPNALLFVLGSSNEDNPYQKTTILHNWLLGYEFPATIFAFTPKKIVMITSAAKAKHLIQLDNYKLSDDLIFQIWQRNNKNPELNAKLFNDLFELLEASDEGKTVVGLPIKDVYQGKFINEWNPLWESHKSAFNVVDCSLGLSTVLENKDSKEQELLRISSKSSDIFMDYLTDKTVNAVDDELRITNAKLSDDIESKIDDVSYLKKISPKLKKICENETLDLNLLDWAYSPIIQSGDSFDLKVSARSTNKQLSGSGSILASCGLRYKNYCSNITRTYLIDPSKEMVENYEFLLKVQNEIITKFLKIGNTPKQAYENVLEFLKEQKKENLIPNLTKNIGSLIGLEFRDPQFVLSAKNDYRKISKGDCFNISLGFNNLKYGDNKNYALQIADTVQLDSITGEPTVLTTVSKTTDTISFYLNQHDEDDTQGSAENDDQSKISERKNVKPRQREFKPEVGGNSKILRTKLRNQSGPETSDNQRQIRREIQRKLHQKLQKDGLLRFSSSEGGNEDEKRTHVFKKYESYIRDSQIPNAVRDLKIHVDWKNQTIIIPIYGRPVPMHINAYKNGSKNEEGAYTYLRLNFHSPGAAGGPSKKSNEIPYEESPDNQFVKSITLRSKDNDRINEVFKQITELKKESTKKDQEKKLMADVVQQAKLIENKSGRTKRLDQVFVRPSPDTKRVPGTVFIHQNGIRYQSPLRSDIRIDVLFSNIKNLFFQSCKGELIVIIHLHLKNPILLGKKKIQDVQFYREASDMAVDETGNNSRRSNTKFRRYGDEDELEQEQEEKRKRAALDKEFKYFAEAISDASKGMVDVDIPFRELGFQGVPGRSAVLCMPTRDCLIQLVEPPFLVVNLNEVEICALERVQFGLKNFDIVFVYKDFSKPVTHINAVPIEELEVIKSWLTDIDIPYTVSTINLNWVNIMKSDPHEFFLNGGWSFLNMGSEDEASDDEEEEAISEYEASEEDPQDESDYSDEYSDDDDDDADDSEDFSGDDESDEGEDWDTLEKKAARADRRGTFKE
ncbi:probable FACT complex subunit SPT16 [Saccharomycodes ludwigii]|uniref:FACT complex subunit n=1 Tax=Saccharomycodes ludwigii TaxID=36035 RepID=A0A376B414_9ASCO|nr:hypothetical protein SCDLUD_002325 [Saccharomycodes ludwigii]KAH3900869.1 hypothetical protein SCDLUD_002325 [Saccharomycodes ludwigii]SSD59319.1 probable FACT complex subunit SPT16 [Saccharomycodes ludwigii]